MLSKVSKMQIQKQLDLVAQELDELGQKELADEVDLINYDLAKGTLSPVEASQELERIAQQTENVEQHKTPTTDKEILRQARAKRAARRILEQRKVASSHKDPVGSYRTRRKA